MKSVKIEFRGHLDRDWADRLDGLTIDHTASGNTILSGSLRDESAVYGLLSSLGGLGLDLVSLTAIDEVKTFCSISQKQCAGGEI